MPEALVHALPDISWHVSENNIYLRPWEAIIIWGRCVNIPSDGEKEEDWSDEGYRWDSFEINPASAFNRFWGILASKMTSDDWSRTTPAAFAIKLRILAKKLFQKTQPELLRVSAIDFIPVMPIYDPPNHTTEVLSWSEQTKWKLQWIRGLRFERSSLADREGELVAWRKLTHFIGDRYDIDACSKGSTFCLALSELTDWLLKKSSDSVKQIMANPAGMLNLRQVEDVVRYFSATIRTLGGFPLCLDAYLSDKDGRLHSLQDQLSYHEGEPSNAMQREMIDRHAANILALSPALRTLLGVEAALWPYPLSQLLLELDAKQSEGRMDVSIITRVEAKLKPKMPLLKELAAQYEDDISARVMQLLSGGGVEATRTNMQSSFATPAFDVFVGTDADTSSFVKMAKEYKNNCSYVSIKKDVLNAKRDPLMKQTDVLTMMIYGGTTAEPARRSNAITLAQLFSKAKGIRSIDPEMSFVPQMMEQSFPDLLGSICMKALDYPDQPVRLSELADMISKIGSLANNPKQFNLVKIAVIPCAKIRFGGVAPKMLEHPFASMEGIEMVTEVFVNIFALLGVDDDDGKARVPPMSPRSLLRTCFEFLRKYQTRDPKLTAKAVEGIILNSVGLWFKMIYDPARSAEDVTRTVPRHFIQQADANLAGLVLVEKAIEAKLARDLAARVDLTPIPAIAALGMSLSDDEVEVVEERKSKKEEKKRKQREEQEKNNQKDRRSQMKDWKETAQLRLTKGGSVFHIDDYTYDIKRMADDLVASNVVTRQEVDKISFPALVLARIIPARVNEAESFAPGREINFSKGTWDSKWKEIFEFVKLGKYRAAEEGGEKERPERRDSRGKGKGGGGRGVVGGRGAGLAGVVLAATTSGAQADSVQSKVTTQEASRTVQDNAVATGAALTWGQKLWTVLMMGLASSPQIRNPGEQPEFAGLQRAGAQYALNYVQILRVLSDPCAPDCAVVGDRSGKVSACLMQKGFRPLAIDPLDSPLPGLRYKGHAEDVLFKHKWRCVYVFLPCDDSATSGAAYFATKVNNGLHYWGMFQCISAFHAPADAVVLEHPASMLEALWRKADQTVHPYYFGQDEQGRERRKTTKLWVRGWNLLQAVRSPTSVPYDYTHSLRIHDPERRSRERSEFIWPMALQIAEQMNPNTVLFNTTQPSLAQALKDFDNNYSKKYGREKLPEGHGNVEYVLSPGFREQLPAHRKATYDEAVRASGRPEPAWPPTRFWWMMVPEDREYEYISDNEANSSDDKVEERSDKTVVSGPKMSVLPVDLSVDAYMVEGAALCLTTGEIDANM